MITQSPESAMPEPYRTYVRQRSEAIAKELEPVVGETDVQLCPRAILPEERIFNTDGSIVYGAVVDDLSHGLKSHLYYGCYDSSNRGIVTDNLSKARQYAQEYITSGSRVRVKDPRESDGQGQYIISSIFELEALFCDLNVFDGHEMVIMPHLEKITERVSIGMIALKQAGTYFYVGREEMAEHEGRKVYGGTQLGLCSSDDKDLLKDIAHYFDIPPHILRMGLGAIRSYCFNQFYGDIKEVGRLSFDVLEGTTHNGNKVTSVVDITPRVGGATPAKVLAIGAIHTTPGALALTRSQLLYNPAQSPRTGTNFIDTETLVINAKIEAVIS